MLVNRTVKFDEKVWIKFKEICDSKGFNRSKLLRNFVEEFVKKND